MDYVFGGVDALRAEAEFLGYVRGGLVRDAGVDVDFCGDDGFGVLFGDVFDRHAALARGDDDRCLASTVHENGEVELATGEFALNEHDGVANTAFLARLLGDEFVADHLVGEHFGFGRAMIRRKCWSLAGSSCYCAGAGEEESYEYTIRTPPLSPLSKCPFPLPPARTCALITISSPPATRLAYVFAVGSFYPSPA